MASCMVSEACASANKIIEAHANENAYATSMKYGKLVESERASCCSAEGQVEGCSTIVKGGSTIVKQQGESSTDGQTPRPSVSANSETSTAVYNTIVQRRTTLDLLDPPETTRRCICIRKTNKCIITFVVMMLVKAAAALAVLYMFGKPSLSFESAAATKLSITVEKKVVVEAFGVKRMSQDSRSNSLMVFNTIVKSSMSNFSTARNFFEVPQSASNNTLYWMNLAFEATGANSQSNVKVSGSHFSIQRSHQNTGLDETISRSGAVKIRAGTQVSIFSQFPTNVAYWSSFQLDELMNPLVAFFVGASGSLQSQGHALFDTVFFNEGNGWISSDHRFVAPHTGIYCFAVTSAISPLKNTVIKMNVNDESFILAQTGTAYVMKGGGLDLTSVSRPLMLTAESAVSVAFEGATPFFSDVVTYPISFSGFYYRPATNVQVVWMVTRTKPAYTDQPEDPVPFDKTLINIGGVWNVTANAVNITRAGLYYVHATLNTYYTGKGMFNVKVNGVKQFEVKSLVVNYKSDQTRSNGAILRLADGDNVTVEQPKLDGGSILAHSLGATSFFGMLILPEL